MKNHKSKLIYLFFFVNIVIFLMPSCKMMSHFSLDPYENDDKIYLKIVSDINQYKNGLKEGIWIKINDSTNIMEICNYKKGVLDGPYFEYFKSGKLCVKGTYKNGKKDGWWYSYGSGGWGGKVVRYKNGKAGFPIVY